MAVIRKHREQELMVVDLIQTAQFLENKLMIVLKPYGITNVQYNILRILRGASPSLLGVGEIKNRMLFRKSDMSRLLDRLVTKELVDRKICPDNRRKMDVKISELGLEVLEKLDVEIDESLFGFYHQIISKEEAMKMSLNLEEIRKYKSIK